MSNAGGYILILRANRKELFEKSLSWYERDTFAEPVQDFDHSKSAALICFVSTKPGKITHIAKARRGMQAGTGLRRLNLKNIVTLKKPVSFKFIVSHTPSRTKAALSSRLASGGPLAPKSFEALVKAMRDLAPDARDLLIPIFVLNIG